MADIKILLATPCSGETVTTTYLRTILKLSAQAPRLNPKLSLVVQTLSIADIYKARNFLAASFMADLSFTHLFFVDADIGFEPRLLEKMLRFDRPFVAALYPYRTLNLRRFHDVARQVGDPELAERLALEFVMGQSVVGESVNGAAPTYTVNAGFVRTKTIGAGVMLLKREVFETLKKAHPELMTAPNQMPYSMMGIKEPVLQCFASLQLEDGNFLSEDISFCYRWDRCGGKIWACVDEDVTHVGQTAYRSAYIDRLKHGMFQT